MDKIKPKILLVEDDPNLSFVIKDNLITNDYSVDMCNDGSQALEAIKKNDFHLCILDIMLPKVDGFTLAKNIRENNTQVPILFLSAKSLDEDKLKGFRLGADDYITKPFSMEELLCRIEVFLKRTTNSTPSDQKWTLRSYVFDYANISIERSGQTQLLTRRESEILRMLCEHQDSVVKREDILMKIWGEDDYFKGRSLDVFISRLRKYLSEDPNIDIINHHGVGFKLETK